MAAVQGGEPGHQPQIDTLGDPPVEHNNYRSFSTSYSQEDQQSILRPSTDVRGNIVGLQPLDARVVQYQHQRDPCSLARMRRTPYVCAESLKNDRRTQLELAAGALNPSDKRSIPPTEMMSDRLENCCWGFIAHHRRLQDNDGKVSV